MASLACRCFFSFTNLGMGQMFPSWSLLNLPVIIWNFGLSDLDLSRVHKKSCITVFRDCTTILHSSSDDGLHGYRIHAGEISISVPRYPRQCICISVQSSTSIMKLKIILSQVCNPSLPHGIQPSGCHGGQNKAQGVIVFIDIKLLSIQVFMKSVTDHPM